MPYTPEGNMRAAEATPRPWRKSTPTDKGASTIVSSANPAELIADIYGYSRDKAEANADIVLRAVNSFDALVEFRIQPAAE
jgi:hypothetical protein